MNSDYLSLKCHLSVRPVTTSCENTKVTTLMRVENNVVREDIPLTNVRYKEAMYIGTISGTCYSGKC